MVSATRRKKQCSFTSFLSFKPRSRKYAVLTSIQLRSSPSNSWSALSTSESLRGSSIAKIRTASRTQRRAQWSIRMWSLRTVTTSSWCRRSRARASSAPPTTSLSTTRRAGTRVRSSSSPTSYATLTTTLRVLSRCLLPFSTLIDLRT